MTEPASDIPEDRPRFDGGHNIALKVPASQFEATVAFYRDVLGLHDLGTREKRPGFHCFQLGPIKLWIDRMEHLSQPEIWLEVRTEDSTAAAAHLAKAGVPRIDAIERLPDGYDGFWIAGPGGIVHLVSGRGGE